MTQQLDPQRVIDALTEQRNRAQNEGALLLAQVGQLTAENDILKGQVADLTAQLAKKDTTT